MKRTPLAALLPAAVLLVGCGGERSLPAGTARNAVLVTLDTTRRNALSAYGCPVPSTPNLDRLGAESLRYEWCRAVAPLTMPSHASMMTGLYPPRHGVRANGFAPLPGAAETLAERAREAGFETAAFVAALVLDRELGLAQGFDVYDQPSRPRRQHTIRYVERPAGEVVDAALGWLAGRADPGRRFLLWVHLFDPHAPWDPAPRFSEQVAGRAGKAHPYIAEVAAMDHELGRLFAALRADGTLADTVVAVVADHGEDLRDHGEPNHAAFVYDSTLRVPFLVRYPDGYRAGEVSEEITSIVDVGPTLVAALGLAPLSEADGLSLWRRPAPSDRGVYFESYHGYLSYGWAPLSGWADAAGKYIHSPEPELYLPAEDRMERRNLAGEQPERVELYRRHIAEVAALPALPADDSATSEELLADLAALGYATAAVRATDLPGPLEDTDRPAPSTRLDEYKRYLEAQQMMEERRLREAVRVLEVIVTENPRHVSALDKLGLCFVIVQGWDPAIVLFEQRLAVAEGAPSTYVNLALAYEHTGQLARAAEKLERALELSPSNETARGSYARVLTKLGRADEAAAYLEDARTGDHRQTEHAIPPE